MPNDFTSVDIVADQLAIQLDHLPWMTGIAVQADSAGGFLIQIRVDPGTPIAIAKLDARIQDTVDDVNVTWAHVEIPHALNR